MSENETDIYGRAETVVRGWNLGLDDTRTLQLIADVSDAILHGVDAERRRALETRTLFFKHESERMPNAFDPRYCSIDHYAVVSGAGGVPAVGVDAGR